MIAQMHTVFLVIEHLCTSIIMPITVKRVSGPPLSVDVGLDKTLGDLRAAIVSEVPAFGDGMKIISGGKVLADGNDDKVLGTDLGFTDATFVVVMASKKKPTPPPPAPVAEVDADTSGGPPAEVTPAPDHAAVAPAAPALPPAPAAPAAPHVPPPAVPAAGGAPGGMPMMVNPQAMMQMMGALGAATGGDQAQMAQMLANPQLMQMMAAFSSMGGQLPEGTDMTQILAAMNDPAKLNDLFIEIMASNMTSGAGEEQLRNMLVGSNRLFKVMNTTHPELLKQLTSSKEFVKGLIKEGVLGIPGLGGQGAPSGGAEEYAPPQVEPADATEEDKKNVDELTKLVGMPKVEVQEYYYEPGLGNRNMETTAALLFQAKESGV